MADKKKLTFEEAREVNIDSQDRNAFYVLAQSEGFKRLKRVVEDYSLKLAHNLINGTETEKDSSVEELKALRGCC